MIYHATTLHILYVYVAYKLDREWCPPSLDMTTFVVTLLVRMIVTPHVSKPHDYVNHMFMRL
jgi:hypothetical protein